MILFNNPVTPLNFVFIVSNNNEQVSIQAFRALKRRMNRERSWLGRGKAIFKKWSVQLDNAQIAFDPAPGLYFRSIIGASLCCFDIR